jgi:hypothetical protein
MEKSSENRLSVAAANADIRRVQVIGADGPAFGPRRGRATIADEEAALT